MKSGSNFSLHGNIFRSSSGDMPLLSKEAPWRKAGGGHGENDR